MFPSITMGLVLSLMSLALAAPYKPGPFASIPTIFVAGDSTAAPGGGGNGTQGWAQYLQYSFNDSQSTNISQGYPGVRAIVNNSATAGRSLRSYTREGRFAAIAELLKEGDWVIIEFGHNDGGSPYPAASDNGRADCPGSGKFLAIMASSLGC
jgi:rhamnogalacturonan acetylesterase